MEDFGAIALSAGDADGFNGPGVRGPEQQVTLYRVGSLLRNGQRELCLVKSVSRTGALIRAYGSLAPDEPVELELKGRAAIQGKVRAVAGADASIDFASAIDVFGLLSAQGGGPPPRMPRIDVRAFALIRQGARVHRATVHNISQGGLSARCDSALQVGGEATVTLTGMGARAGVVRWSKSGGCGITFNALLGLPLLVEWLHAQSPAQAVA